MRRLRESSRACARTTFAALCRCLRWSVCSFCLVYSTNDPTPKKIRSNNRTICHHLHQQQQRNHRRRINATKPWEKYPWQRRRLLGMPQRMQGSSLLQRLRLLRGLVERVVSAQCEVLGDSGCSMRLGFSDNYRLATCKHCVELNKINYTNTRS